jgi:hypothetical protein
VELRPTTTTATTDMNEIVGNKNKTLTTMWAQASGCNPRRNVDNVASRHGKRSEDAHLSRAIKQIGRNGTHLRTQDHP